MDQAIGAALEKKNQEPYIFARLQAAGGHCLPRFQPSAGCCRDSAVTGLLVMDEPTVTCGRR
jgi:hypothetical protein